MQDAADEIMWETFDHPGASSQAMLPPQPSRAFSQGQRTSSIGQPLQLMDSNQSLPYTGKGKGRARDFEPNQQRVFAGREQANVEGSGQLRVPYIEDVQQFFQQPQNAGPGTFTFAPGQITPWQPVNPDYAQPTSNLFPQSADFQPVQTQAHPHAHPHPVRTGPAPPPQQPPQIPPQQPLPAFPLYQQQQPPSLFLHPNNNPHPPPHWQNQPTPPFIPLQQQTHQFPLTPLFRVGVGYRFRPGRGFICQVCGTALQQPGLHLFAVEYGKARWCEAAGTEMAETLNLLEEGRGRRGRRGPFV